MRNATLAVVAITLMALSLTGCSFFDDKKPGLDIEVSDGVSEKLEVAIEAVESTREDVEALEAENRKLRAQLERFQTEITAALAVPEDEAEAESEDTEVARGSEPPS